MLCISCCKILDLCWLDSIAKLSLFVMVSCLGGYWWKEALKKKSNFSCKYRFQRQSAYLDAKVSRFYFLLQGVKAHTHKSFIIVPALFSTIYITHSHVFVCSCIELKCSYILVLHVLGLCLGNGIHMWTCVCMFVFLVFWTCTWS